MNKKILVLMMAVLVGCSSMFANDFNDTYVLVEEGVYFDTYEDTELDCFLWASKDLTIDEEPQWEDIWYSNSHFTSIGFFGDSLKTLDEEDNQWIYDFMVKENYTYVAFCLQIEGELLLYKTYKVGTNYITLVYQYLGEDN